MGDLLYKYKNEDFFRNNFNSRILRKTETKVKFPWFTLNGFRALAATYKCEEATIIRNFYFS